MKDRIFYSICFGFILGVLLRSFIFVDFYLAILFGVIAFSLILFFALISKNNWGILISIFVLAFCLGVFRFHISDLSASNSAGILADKVGQSVSLTGEVTDEPSVGESNQKLLIRTVLKEVSPRTVLEESTKILVSTNLEQDFKYGDEISFSGKLEKPENFITDQGKVFDYVNYLRKDDIFYIVNYANLEIISRGNGNKIKSTLFYIKDKFLEKINAVINSPESLLMGGLILGEKSAFSQELRTNFVNTGTIHVIALSGYNVTIVAEWFMSLFAFLPQSLGIGMGILAVLFFILMTGGSSTAVRAGTMATLALIARATGRNYDVARALLLAGVGMILINPFILVHDVSFQLSFIATVAVIFFAPRIEKYFMWVPKSFKLRDIVSVTCAAYIFVFPFILYKMGNFSIVALPANVLILPFIPLTMLLGFLTGLVGLFLNILSIPVGYITYLFLHYELGVINFFASLPFSAFNFPNFPLLLTLLIYSYFIYRLFGKSLASFFTKPF
ncbi:MAG: ComEC/Rec2 family competence protein [Candidatus Parcubacteria bacterium]|nr:ComEC/Rec2 family competence protein [Candidatus Parcubacteria bacterium]